MNNLSRWLTLFALFVLLKMEFLAIKEIYLFTTKIRHKKLIFASLIFLNKSYFIINFGIKY